MYGGWKNCGYFILIFVFLIQASAIPKPDEDQKTRVHDAKLSDQEHFVDGEHNPDYDHDAFLGDEAESFEDLTPEESKERLSLIVDKIDKDGNDQISQQELKEWISYTQRRYIRDDVDRQWATHNPENKDSLPWAVYQKLVYGFMDDMDPQDLEVDDNMISYADMEKRDKRRWEVADRNNDQQLDKDEFTDFLHPEEAAHMRDIVVVETMEDIDKDKDGKISLEEYIGDMYRGSDGDEPSWVTQEREQFAQFRDKDGDGFMDKEEVKSWIIPPDYDQSDAEAKHLIFESDLNKDGELSKEEVLDHYDLFVGSQATDFGEALVRHDEF